MFYLRLQDAQGSCVDNESPSSEADEDTVARCIWVVSLLGSCFVLARDGRPPVFTLPGLPRFLTFIYKGFDISSYRFERVQPMVIRHLQSYDFFCLGYNFLEERNREVRTYFSRI